MTVVCFWLQAPSKKKIEINTIASNYHLEVNARYLKKCNYCTEIRRLGFFEFFSVTTKTYIMILEFFCSLLCSDAGNQDRVVIQELIKTVAQSQQIQSSTQKEFKGQRHLSCF